jgi:GNAT superfamily N-acetyltransferase
VSERVADGVFYVRDSELPDGRWAVSAYSSTSFAEGEIVDAAAAAEAIADPATRVVWRTFESERGIIRIERGASEVPGAPNIWFVNVDEPKANPRATNLVGFATDHFEPGTVVNRYQFASLGLPNDEQVGAIRWYTELAIVHQVFVAEEWRRRRAGSAILYAADAFHQSMGWPGTLKSDGRHTDLGQQFLAAQSYPARFPSRTAVMPPMDPA